MILLWCGSTTNGMLWCFLISFSSIPQTFILTEEVLQSFHMFHCCGVTAKLASGFTSFFFKTCSAMGHVQPKNGRMIPPDFGIWPNQRPSTQCPGSRWTSKCRRGAGAGEQILRGVFLHLSGVWEGQGKGMAANVSKETVRVRILRRRCNTFNTYQQNQQNSTHIYKWEVDHSS